jgi:hypothetical protein
MTFKKGATPGKAAAYIRNDVPTMINATPAHHNASKRTLSVCGDSRVNPDNHASHVTVFAVMRCIHDNSCSRL